MEEPPRVPVRLTVTDDCARSRLTVGFRLILAIPHFFWLAAWTSLVWFLALIGWVIALVKRRLPEEVHDFIASYVRYTVHVGAYLALAANPYPSFVPGPSTTYPVDVEFDGPRDQNRWKVGFRIVLAIPALLFSGTVLGGYAGGTGGARGSSYGLSGGLVSTVSVLGWFACVFTGRMPRGLRDAALYGVGYGAQVDAYLLLLTDRYPTSDPAAAPAEPQPAHPIRLEVRDELRRSRLTVFFRLPLAVVHLVWLALWGIVALVAGVANWLGTLATGRSPDALYRFLAAYLRYSTHVSAFLYLVGNPFPGFVGREGSYPVDLLVAPPERQHRAVTGFRIVLAFPALLVSSALGGVLAVVALFGWFASLFTARMPAGLRAAGAYALRYSAQVNGYLMLLTDAYPYAGPSRAPVADQPAPVAGLPVA